MYLLLRRSRYPLPEPEDDFEAQYRKRYAQQHDDQPFGQWEATESPASTAPVKRGLYSQVPESWRSVGPDLSITPARLAHVAQCQGCIDAHPAFGAPGGVPWQDRLRGWHAVVDAHSTSTPIVKSKADMKTVLHKGDYSQNPTSHYNRVPARWRSGVTLSPAHLAHLATCATCVDAHPAFHRPPSGQMLGPEQRLANWHARVDAHINKPIKKSKTVLR